MINFTFFDVADAVLENLIGPVFILLIKFLVSQLLSLLCFRFCAILYLRSFSSSCRWTQARHLPLICLLSSS